MKIRNRVLVPEDSDNITISKSPNHQLFPLNSFRSRVLGRA